MRAALLALTFLLLAGCGAPPPVPAPTPSAVAAPHYDLTVRVSQERPDGPAMPGVGLQSFLLDDNGGMTPGPPGSTDARGAVHWSFPAPVRLALRADASGWTREGGVVDVGPQVRSSDLLVSDRDVFVSLYHLQLHLTAAGDLMTQTVQPAADGSLQAPPPATADLALPDGLQAAYLSRLTAADIWVRWDDTATDRADVAAGLAWDGATWVAGPAAGPGLLPGPREAAFTGAVPEDRPTDLAGAHLQAAAVLHSAVVGHVPLAFEVTLHMAGHEPPGLPPTCGHAARCVPLPLPA
jgi:hypothetical protein